MMVYCKNSQGKNPYIYIGGEPQYAPPPGLPPVKLIAPN